MTNGCRDLIMHVYADYTIRSMNRLQKSDVLTAEEYTQWQKDADREWQRFFQPLYEESKTLAER